MDSKTLIIICILIYLILIVVFSLFKKTSKGINNSYLNLIKPLIPSWKFYDDYEETIMLFFRIGNSPWFQIYRSPKPALSSLLVNAEGNFVLAAHSHIEQLLNDIDVHQDNTRFEETLSYKITKNFVWYAIKKQHSLVDSFQFKLSTVDENGEPKDDILLSPVYTGDLN